MAVVLGLKLPPFADWVIHDRVAGPKRYASWKSRFSLSH